MKMKTEIEELLEDLAQLYWRLNHGDDEELLRIVQKHGYSFDIRPAETKVVRYDPSDYDED
jgi:hypothetical protein